VPAPREAGPFCLSSGDRKLVRIQRFARQNLLRKRNSVARKTFGISMNRQFYSIADVDSWLNWERLLCPRCGERFEHLGRHLAASHHISADEFRMRYGIPHNRGLVGIGLKKRLVDRQRLELARNRGHRAKFVGAHRRRPYSVHPPSAAQLGDLRNRIQPLGNRKRWAKSKIEGDGQSLIAENS
jgi:hypothetical protein